jgi:hypothetical protein
MNEVRLLVFNMEPINVIGTGNLNGCTGVAIKSPLAAIVRHIPPQPFATLDPGAGLRNLQMKMDEMLALYHQYPQCFPPGQTSLILGPRYDGAMALPNHIAAIQYRLEQEGLNSTLMSYDISTQGFHPNAAQGTLMIDARYGDPVVYA